MGANGVLGRTSGPAFVNTSTRKQSTTLEMNEIFVELLSELLEERKELFPVDVITASDVCGNYNVFRSLRRGSESRAMDMDVSGGDRYIGNRWRKKERAGTSKIALSIDQSYVDMSLAKSPFLRYTGAM